MTMAHLRSRAVKGAAQQKDRPVSWPTVENECTTHGIKLLQKPCKCCGAYVLSKPYQIFRHGLLVNAAPLRPISYKVSPI